MVSLGKNANQRRLMCAVDRTARPKGWLTKDCFEWQNKRRRLDITSTAQRPVTFGHTSAKATHPHDPARGTSNKNQQAIENVKINKTTEKQQYMQTVSVRRFTYRRKSARTSATQNP